MRRSVLTAVAVVAAFVLTLVLLVAGTSAPNQDNDPSSRVSGKAGTLALYRWLGTLGFNVHRISGQFDLSGTDVLVIADPSTPITTTEAGAVVRSLAAGADLVLAVSPDSEADAQALLTRLRIDLDPGRPAGDSVPAQPIDAGDRVRHVPMGAGSSIEASPSVTPLLDQEGQLTAVAEQVAGAGRAYVLASPFPLSNDGLRDADSSTLVLSMLERARGGAIGFDEFHHGEVDAVADGAAAVFESPLGIAAGLAVVVVLTFLALSGRRLGRPVRTGDAALVPTTGSYIHAMAGLYQRSRDRGVVAARYADELRSRLGLPPGIPGEPGDPAVVDAARLSRPDLADEVAAVLSRARALARATPDAQELLALARAVDEVERRWAERPAVTTAQ